MTDDKIFIFWMGFASVFIGYFIFWFFKWLWKTLVEASAKEGQYNIQHKFEDIWTAIHQDRLDANRNFVRKPNPMDAMK